MRAHTSNWIILRRDSGPDITKHAASSDTGHVCGVTWAGATDPALKYYALLRHLPRTAEIQGVYCGYLPTYRTLLTRMFQSSVHSTKHRLVWSPHETLSLSLLFVSFKFWWCIVQNRLQMIWILSSPQSHLRLIFPLLDDSCHYLWAVWIINLLSECWHHNLFKAGANFGTCCLICRIYNKEEEFTLEMSKKMFTHSTRLILQKSVCILSLYQRS